MERSVRVKQLTKTSGVAVSRLIQAGILFILGLASSLHAAVITLAPDNEVVEVGADVSVSIQVSQLGGDKVGAYDLVASWNPAVLRLKNAFLGTELDGPYRSLHARSTSPGSINLAEFSFHALSGQSEPVVLGTLSFTALAAGNANLSVVGNVAGAAVFLGDAAGSPFSADISITDIRVNTAPNAEPVADAGGDQSILKGHPLAATIYLDGTGSSDADDDSLNYRWHGPFGTASGPTPSVDIPEGKYTVSLTVDDGCSRSTDESAIEVLPCFAITARSKPGKVQLTWVHLEGNERYDIYRSDESNPSRFIKIGETTSTFATFLDEPVTNERTYLYVVGALSQGTWCYSNVTSSHPISRRTQTSSNYAPLIYSSPIEQGTVGISYNYDVNAADPNNNELNYALLNSPSGMSIDPSTGRITWNPVASGIVNVTVEVSDGNGGSDAQNFQITVEDLPDLNCPVAAHGGGQ